MTIKEFIAYYERAYSVTIDPHRFMNAASFLSGYATAVQDFNDPNGEIARRAADFMVAARFITALKEKANEDTK